jgi:hypothetical protein
MHVQVSENLSELRLVQLSDLTKREVIIGRLPLSVQTSVVEDWQSLYEAASNPTKWYRQPFVLIVLVRLLVGNGVAMGVIGISD